jgi:hypothetical protein
VSVLLGVIVVLATGLVVRDPALEAERQTAAAFRSFREQAANDLVAAVRAHGTDALAKRVSSLEPALWPVSSPRVGWSWLVSTAVPAVGGPGSARPICGLYNPWADVVLVAEWKRGPGRLELADLDVLPADCVRRKGQPPFAIERPWASADRFPPAALQATAVETVDAFERMFANGAEGGPWRARLAPGGDDGWNRVWRPAAGFLSARALLAISEYRHPERGEPRLLTALRPALDRALADARAGRGGPTARPGLAITSVVVGKERAYAFAVDPGRADGGAVAFSFEAKDGRLGLARRDVVGLPGARGLASGGSS